MGVSPSGQDVTMIQKFLDLEPDDDKWYIMMIVNKRNDITIRFKTPNYECDMEPKIVLETAKEIEEAISRIGRMAYSTFGSWNSNTGYSYNNRPSTASNIGFQTDGGDKGNEKSKTLSKESNSSSIITKDQAKEVNNSILDIWTSKSSKKEKKQEKEKTKENAKTKDGNDLMVKLYNEVLEYKDGEIKYAIDNLLSEDQTETIQDSFNHLYSVWIDNNNYWHSHPQAKREGYLDDVIISEKDFVYETFTSLSTEVLSLVSSNKNTTSTVVTTPKTESKII